MLRRLLFGTGAAPTYALQPKPTAFVSTSQGGGCFFSTSLPRSSDSPPLITFFRKYGIREEDADVILGKLPRLRDANVENTLRPKLDFLLSTNLTGAEISEILVANPHILGRSLENTIASVNFLETIVPSKGDLIRVLKRSTNLAPDIESNVEILKQRGVRGAQILKMLTSQPNAFARRREDFLAAVGHVEDLGLSPNNAFTYARALVLMSCMSRSTFLRKLEVYKQLGWSENQVVELIRKFPMVLTLSEDNVRKKMDFFRQKAGWSEDQLVEVIRKAPMVLGLSEDNISKKMEFFRERALKAGWSEDQVMELIRKFPKVMTLSEDNIRKKMEFFTEKVGLSEDQVVEMIRKFPKLMGLSEDNIRKKMEFFREKVGWSEDKVLEVIRKSPMVLGMSEDNIRKIMDFFRQKAGWSESQMVEVINKFPMVLGLTEDNVRKKMDLFRQKAGWSEDQVVELIRKFPKALSLSENNIRKKMEFFVEKARWGADCLSTNPDFIGRSLEKRIIPRCVVLNILMSRGLLKKDVRSPFWLRYTDKCFFDRYVRRYESQVPDVVDAFHGHIDFQGWDWLKGDDGNNAIN